MHISVIDNGLGIKPEIILHINERFSRANTALDAHISGLGLGVAIVKSIMEMHNGHLNISKSTHHGACISLVLNFELIVKYYQIVISLSSSCHNS